MTADRKRRIEYGSRTEDEGRRTQDEVRRKTIGRGNFLGQHFTIEGKQA